MVPENIQGSTSTLIREKFPEEAFLEKPFMWRTQAVGFTCAWLGPLSHTGVRQKLYELIFQILFLSGTDLGLFS